MRTLLVVVALLAGCGSDDASSPDMQTAPDLAVHLCLAIACVDHCPATNSHCIITHATDQYGGCTDGSSTCGRPLTGDCSFTTRCLDASTMGMLFIASPEGGCGIERYHCNNGCVDPRADGGVGPEAHCNP